MHIHRHKALLALLSSNVWANLIYLASFAAIGAILDPVEFGAFRVAQVYLSVAVSVAMLGLNTAVTHQLPQLPDFQKQKMLHLSVVIMIISSIVVGAITYFLIPEVSGQSDAVLEVAYFLSFPVAVAGASLANLSLSVYQAQGELTRFAGLQLQWKTMVFLFGVLGSLMLQAKIALIFMAAAYGAVYWLQRRNRPGKLWPHDEGPARLADVIRPLYKGSIWPFASICVSVIYSNIEFIFIDSTDIGSGVAGAYSLASLIFIGGAAFFMPLQTYAGSMVVKKKIDLRGLFKLQIVCLFAVAGVALSSWSGSKLLSHFFPLKFNQEFLSFAVLVCVKLSVWGGYAVIGSVLNYLDKGFESFLLSIFCMAFILLISRIPGHFDSLYEIIKLQISSNFILLIGCVYLVIRGHSVRDGVKGHS
jgi:O-antigen/teichoic acid export membrane protein